MLLYLINIDFDDLKDRNMRTLTYHLTVVSLERQIFLGIVKKIKVVGCEGEMEVFSGHAPLLTCIKPGILHIVCVNTLEYIYLSGGILEIQGNIVTILADVAIRANELDELAAKAAKVQAETYLHCLRYDDKDYMKASLELSQIIAKLRLFELVKSGNCI